MWKGWKKKSDLIPVTVEEVDVKESTLLASHVVGEEKNAISDDYEKYKCDLGMEGLTDNSPEVVSTGAPENNSGDVVSSSVDVSSVFAGLEGGSGTADAVRALARREGKDSLYMISNLKQPSNITKLRLHAEYAESVGFKKKARFLKFLADAHVEDVVSKEGDNNRAKMIKEGLNVEVNKEFEIEKRSKMGALQ